MLEWKTKIAIFLQKKLNLKLHPKKLILREFADGINFCGYIIKPDYILVRKRTVKKLKNTLWQFNQKIINFTKDRYRLNANEACVKLFNEPFSVFDSPDIVSDFQHILASVNSTYGFLKHADCFGLRKTIYRKHFGILKIYLRPVNANFDFFVWNNVSNDQ